MGAVEAAGASDMEDEDTAPVRSRLRIVFRTAAILSCLLGAACGGGSTAGDAQARAAIAGWDEAHPHPDAWGAFQRRRAAALIAVAEGGNDPIEMAALADEADRMERHLEAVITRLDLARVLELTDRGRAIDAWRRAGAEAAAIGAPNLGAVADRALRRLGVRTWRRGRGRTGVSSNAGLTDREQEILTLLSSGMTNPEIADRLFLSRKTVERHVSNVLAKLGVRNRAELAGRFALRSQGRGEVDAGQP